MFSFLGLGAEDKDALLISPAFPKYRFIEITQLVSQEEERKREREKVTGK